MLFDTNNEATAQRTDIAVFFDVKGYEGVTAAQNEEVYARAGAAWTTFTENPNAQTKERKFISEKTARSNITSYKPQWAFEALLMYERPEIRHIYDAVKKRTTGSQLLMTFIVADLFDMVSEGVYAARKVRAVPQISELNDDEDMIIKGTFYNQGDETEGTFDIKAGTFTPASSAPASPTVSYALTASEPDDWDTNYNDYYTKSGDEYIKNNEQSAPTWEADTYYRKVVG